LDSLDLKLMMEAILNKKPPKSVVSTSG